MGLFRKAKTHIRAKFHWTDLVIYSHSREGKTLSYSRINRISNAALLAHLKECTGKAIALPPASALALVALSVVWAGLFKTNDVVS